MKHLLYFLIIFSFVLYGCGKKDEVKKDETKKEEKKKM